MENQGLRQLLIETDVDKLVNLIAQKGKVSMKDASKRLGIKASQIEDWAKVLEEHGLVKIVYPFVGDPRIELATIPVDRKVREFGDRKEQLKARTEQLVKKTAEVKLEVRMTDVDFKKLDKELREKLADAQKRMNEMKGLGELKRSTDADMARWQEMGKHVAEKTTQLESQSKALSGDIMVMQDTVDKMDAGINRALAACEQHGGNIRSLEGEKKNIEYEIALLDKEIRLVSALAKHPINIPIFGGLIRALHGGHKNLKQADTEKEKVKEKVKELHKAGINKLAKPPKPGKAGKPKKTKAKRHKADINKPPKPEKIIILRKKPNKKPGKLQAKKKGK